METKGIRVLVAAHDILCRRGRSPPHRRRARPGKPDRNLEPRDCSLAEGRPKLVLLGYVQDIAGLWAGANVAVLPSLGGEGVPASLLEAAACGRPL